MIADPTPHRVSACPVHFLWDGRGGGRTLVRLGFLGLVVAGALAALAVMTRHSDVQSGAQLTTTAALVTWGLGQLWSYAVIRRTRASNDTGR